MMLKRSSLTSPLTSNKRIKINAKREEIVAKSKPMNNQKFTPKVFPKEPKIIINDVITEIYNTVFRHDKLIVELHKQIEELAKKVEIMSETSISNTSGKIQNEESSLLTNNVLVDFISNEVSDRLERAYNVIVFNVPDNLSLNYVKSSILKSCNLTQEQCVCIRLRKKKIKFSCPIMFKFVSPISARKMLSCQDSIEANNTLKKIFIRPDLSPNQRRVYKMKPYESSQNITSNKPACSNEVELIDLNSEITNSQSKCSHSLPKSSIKTTSLNDISVFTKKNNPLLKVCKKKSVLELVDLDSSPISKMTKNIKSKTTVRSKPKIPILRQPSILGSPVFSYSPGTITKAIYSRTGITNVNVFSHNNRLPFNDYHINNTNSYAYHQPGTNFRQPVYIQPPNNFLGPPLRNYPYT